MVHALGITNPEHKTQGHGLTVKEMKELQQAQLAGDAPVMDTNKDTNTFKIPAAEAHRMHVSLENTEFDPKTGARKSKAFVRSFDVQDFIRMTKERAFEGLEVVILHDPRAAKDQAVNTIQLPIAIDPEKMNEQQLRAKYLELFGEEADVLISPAELRIELKQKLEFISSEEKEASIRAAADGGTK